MNYRARKITVMGLGSWGGGIGVAKYLAKKGAAVTVTDLRTREHLADSMRQLSGFDIRYVLGRHEESDFKDCDMVVVSPAVKPNSPFVKIAEDAGKEITTEIGIFLENCPSKHIVGITGTNGKSTTVTLLGMALAKVFPEVVVGGNIGGSLLDRVDEITSDCRVVLELSSFQLHYLSRSRFSPRFAAITNIADDHIDWHGSLEHYIASKCGIFRFQDSSGVFVTNADNEYTRGLKGPGKTVCFSRCRIADVYFQADKIKLDAVSIDVSRRKLPGRHNVENMLAVAALLSQICSASGKQGWESACETVFNSYQGLPHRIELVYEDENVRIYNDSKSTTPAATVTALDAVAQPVLVIVCGKNKGMDVKGMAHAITVRAKTCIVFGEISNEVSAAIRDFKPDFDLVRVENISEAVATAKRKMPRGSILFSPGFASFDQFKNYEHRGDVFREEVKKVFGGASEL